MDVEIDIGSYAVIPIKEPYEDVVTTYKICDVLQERSVQELKRVVPLIPLEAISSDLSQFHQSSNLDQLSEQPNLPPALRKFLDFLKSSVRQTVEQIFKLPTRAQITATVSKYTKGDYLLCHDDLMNTRAVAFVYYLSDLTVEDGGDLHFFAHDEEKDPIAGCYEKEVPPHQNTLVLFRVSQTSHHEVEQIYTDSERWSINGWFHHLEPNDDDDVILVNRVFKSSIVKLTMPTGSILPPNKIISKRFLLEEGLNEMATHLKTSKDLALVVHDVLPKHFFEVAKLELADSNNLPWELKGPANFRHYETLPYDVEGPHINFGESLFNIGNLVDYLLSQLFLKALSKIAGVDYAIFKDTDIPPTCMVEVQRWKEGSYSLLLDNNVEREMPTVEVTVFFQVNQNMIGSLSSDTDFSGIVVQTIKPPMLTERDVNKLYRIKWNRICMAHAAAAVKKHTKAQHKSLCNSISSVVGEKIDKLQKYRKFEVPENTLLTPQDNTMIITYGSRNVSKYTSYIKKKDAVSDPGLCYYAVNVTYFTA